MSVQPDLFAPQAAADDHRCGLCVHRNALTMAARGYCTPGGWRDADQPGCGWWFGREQLRLACARKPK